MYIVQPSVDRYLLSLASLGDPVLKEMERAARRRDFPIVGPQVGRLLYVLARAARARRVLDLGSGFGYSGYWFAKAVGARGRVDLTEGSAERADEAAAFLERAGLRDRVRIHVGDAFEIAGLIRGVYDIVFNDVEKRDYPRVLPVARALLRPGGLLVCDNMLWSGSVLDGRSRDEDTRGVIELTRRLYASREFFTALVPVRDGVTISIRRESPPREPRGKLRAGSRPRR